MMAPFLIYDAMEWAVAIVEELIEFLR